MWGSLAFDAILIAGTLYLPGCFIARMFRLDAITSICTAPMFSMFAILSAALVFAGLGCGVNGLAIIAPLMLLGLLSFLFRLFAVRGEMRKQAKRLFDFAQSADFGILILYVALSTATCLSFYVLSLDSAVSFFQGFDNYYHISQVRTFIETGAFASLAVFSYPNLWHTMVSVFASALSSFPTVAANAFNIVVLSLVVPTSVYLFFRTVFCREGGQQKRGVMIAGSIVLACSTTFPWNYIVNGPLYPLFVGWSLLPIAMAFYLEMIRARLFSKRQLLCLTLFLLASSATAVGHPSCIFSAIVLMTPATFSEILFRNESRTRSYISAAVFLVFVCVFWIACYRSPLFSGVLSFDWGTKATFGEALYDTLVLSLMPTLAPQIILSMLTFVGCLFAWNNKKLRWLVGSLVIAGCLYAVSMGVPGQLKNLLTGFFYTDQNRTAALLGFALIPLASIGLWNSIMIVSRLFRVTEVSVSSAFRFACVLVAVPLLISSFAPSFPNGSYSSDGEGKMVAGAGFNYRKLVGYNSLGSDAFCYDLDEIHFVDRVKGIVGSDLVLNYPYDGSLYAYAFNGLNVVNRDWWFTDYESDDPLTILRTGINRLQDDPGIRQACYDADVYYVMILDYGHLDGEGVFTYEHIVPEAWTGLTSFDDDTPGFRLLLSEGDMRLYEVESPSLSI